MRVFVVFGLSGCDGVALQCRDLLWRMRDSIQTALGLPLCLIFSSFAFSRRNVRYIRVSPVLKDKIPIPCNSCARVQSHCPNMCYLVVFGSTLILGAKERSACSQPPHRMYRPKTSRRKRAALSLPREECATRSFVLPLDFCSRTNLVRSSRGCRRGTSSILEGWSDGVQCGGT